MADIFENEGIAPPKRDIFAEEGIAPPSFSERNDNALTPPRLDTMPQEVQDNVISEQDNNMRLARARYSEEEIEAMKAKGPIGFWESKDFLSIDDVKPFGGFDKTFKLNNILNAAEKIKNGEELNGGEEELMNNFIHQHIEKGIRGFSVGGGISYYGSQMPAFMVEFAATAGVGKLAQQGAVQLTEKAITNAILTKTAGVAANVTARTAAMPTLYAPKYTELRLNDYAAITDKGAIIFQESTESPAISALKAFGYTSAEVASEMSGAALGKYVIQPITKTAGKYLKTPIVAGAKHLPIGLKQNLYKAYKAVQPNATVSKIFTTAGWNGMLEELGEERVADILRESLNLAIDDDYTFDDYLDNITPTKDQLLIEAGIISIAGGVKSAADIGLNILTEKIGDPIKAREIIDNMSATEQDNFVEKNLNINMKPVTDQRPATPQGYGIYVEAAKRAETEADFFNEVDQEIEYQVEKGIITEEQATEIEQYFEQKYREPVKGQEIEKDTEYLDDWYIGARNFMTEVRNGDFDQADPNQLTIFGEEFSEPVNGIPALFRSSGESAPSLTARNITSPTGSSGASSQDLDAESQRTGTPGNPSLSFDTATMSPLRNAGSVSIGRMSSTSNYIIYHNTKDVKVLSQNAKALEPELRSFLDSVSQNVNGAEFIGTRIKEKSSLDKKIMGKGRDADGIADIIGGRIVVDNYKAIQQVVDNIGKRARVLELENKMGAEDGQYKAVHLIVMASNGMATEIQIQPRPIREVQDEAHVIYKKWQNVKKVDDLSKAKKKKMLEDFEKSRQLFSDAWAKWKEQTKGQTSYSEQTFIKPLIQGDQADLSRVQLLGADPITQSQMKAAAQQNPPEINEEESSFQRFYREFVNDLQPIEDLVKDAEGRGAELLPGENPFFLSRTYAGIIGHIESNLKYGTTELDKDTGVHKINGKALKAILDDLDNSIAHVEGNRDSREQDFNDYLIARRTIEDLQDRDDVNVSEKDRIKSLEDMARLSDKYGDDFQWFSEFAEEMYDYQRRVLHNLVDARVMSQEQYDEIIENNPNYIPFQRVIEEESYADAVNSKGVFTDADSKKVIKRLHGSDKDIKFTTHSVIKNTAKIADIAYRNRVAIGVADLADIMPDYVQKVKGSMLPGLTPKQTITVFRDGKKEFYKVSPALSEAMESLNPVEKAGALKYLKEIFLFTPARLVRGGATLVPEFWLRNVLRDQGTALLQSPVRPTPIDMVQGLASVIGGGKLYQEWVADGGSFNSYMELDDKGIEKAYKELFRPQGKMARYFRNPINLLADISNTLEQGTRVGAYKKARQRGHRGVEAALLSREATLDFARGGISSRKINKGVPFFNAGVQSVDKMLRTFKENPAGTMFWGVATITIPSIVITGYYLYAAPEEERQEYLEIPQWQKDLFWVFKSGDQWVRIPKPFSFGYLFGSVPERFMIWGYQNEKPEIPDFWREFAMGIAGTVTPVYDPGSAIPPLFKTYIESRANYNFFTGRRIYPDWMNRYVPEQRANKFNSETSKVLGEQLGVSPAIVDNTIRGLLASSGSYVTDAGDIILNQVKEWNGEEIPEEPITPSDQPIVRAFTVREPTGSGTNSVSAFYDNYNTVSQAYATFKSLEGDDRDAFLDKNQKAIQAYKPIKGFYDQIKKFNKISDRIWEDPSMSSEDKVEALSNNGDRILEVAKKANDWFKEQQK